jgi:hypothetical protein
MFYAELYGKEGEPDKYIQEKTMNECLICEVPARNTIMHTLPKGGRFCTECAVVNYPSKGPRPEHSHFCHPCQGVWTCLDPTCDLPLEFGCNISEDKCNGNLPTMR